MEYPLISEYIDAILSAEDNLATLNNLRPVLDGRGRPVMSSGNFAVVFKMKSVDSGRCYAVKCFIKDQEGRAEAYQRISQELEFVSSPYILHVQYLENELFVDTTQTEQEEFPVLKMEWVEGKPLDAYLRENIYDNYALEMLTYRFCRMGAFLLSQPFAHGDLKPDNILVRENGELVLVDYDGMFVPSMEGQKARELGSPDFRHPLRDENLFDSHIDDFAIASIALSLKAIALDSSLLEKYGATDRLLFSAEDNRALGESNVLKAMTSLSSDSIFASLHSAFLLASAKNNLSMLSFRLFTFSMPEKKQLELSTEVTEDDLANAIYDKYGVAYSKDGLKLLKSNKSIVNYAIKIGTKVICDGAFANCESLNNITIPSSVTSIGKSAFRECSILTSVVIPNSVTSIDTWAFSGCYSLKFIVLPNLIENINSDCFRNCHSLASIVLPDSITKIGSRAFLYCSSLASITIPQKVKSIGSRSFWGCKELSEISLPKELTSIEDLGLRTCYNLKFIRVPDGQVEKFSNMKALRQYEEKIFSTTEEPFDLKTEVSGKDRSSAVEDEFGVKYSRDGRRLIRWINNHDCKIKFGTVIICDHAFERLDSLKSIEIPPGVRKIGRDAFGTCKSLQSITVPNTIISIGRNCFQSCRSLKSIEIPDSLSYLGQSAFSGCVGLEYVKLSNSINSIGEATFQWCSFVNFIIPDSVAEIERSAFRGCKFLRSIEIPVNVGRIGFCAFSLCESLHTVTINSPSVEIEDKVFDGCASLQTIIIPQGTKQKFEKLLPEYKDKLVEQ